MSEVEKMYRNSGIEKHRKTMLDIETGKNVLTLDSFYPEFTAEKQLKIMELLGEVHIIKDYEGKGESISEALASLVNGLWQDLTEEERKQVKGILE